MIRKQYTYSIVLLLACIAALILHHASYFYGYFGFDDLHYARLSALLLDGHIDYSDHYSYRWPVLAFTSISYALFGISDLSSALPTLSLSFGILGGLAWLFRRQPFALLVSLLLFFAIRWNVFYTDKLMPDVYLSFFLFIAWICYVKMSSYKEWHLGIVMSTALLLAFMSKGTVILIAPLLLFYLIADVKRGHGSKWKPILASGLLLLLGYGVSCYMLTGNALARFDAISANSYYNDCSYSEMPISHTIERLTSGFFTMIWNESLIIFLIMAILARIISAYTVDIEKNQRSIRFHTNTIFVLFLSMNFMTFSLTSYNPGCLDIRHYIFCVPIMSASIGYVLIALDLPLRWQVLVALGLVICLKPTYDLMVYSKSLRYSDTKHDIQAIVQSLKDDDRVYVASPVMCNLIDYYNAFDDDERTMMTRDYAELGCSGDCYLLSNWYSEFHSKTNLDGIKRDLGDHSLQELDDNDGLTHQMIGTRVFMITKASVDQR